MHYEWKVNNRHKEDTNKSNKGQEHQKVPYVQLLININLVFAYVYGRE